MPPKFSVKPNLSKARVRRKQEEAVDAGSDNENDVHMDGGSEGEGEDAFEDEMQKQERLLEEEEALKRRAVRTTIPVIGSSSSSSKPAEKTAVPPVATTTPATTTAAMATSTSTEASTSEPASSTFARRTSTVDYPSVDDMQVDSDFMETDEPPREPLPDFADEGDELIKEIPVFLSQQLAKYLYLFQYPVRASQLPFDSISGPNKARIKPNAQLIELEIPIDTKASQYSRQRGEELALGMNDKPIKTAYDMELIDEEEEKELLDKQILTSSLIPTATNYLAGVLRNDELHLTPIHGTVQLRPSFKYLDKIDEKQKQANRKVNDEADREHTARIQAEQEAKAKAVQVQVRSAADTEARRVGGPNKARLAEEENWTRLDYFNVETDESEVIYDRMFATQIGELDCVTSVEEYLDMVSSLHSLRGVDEK
ncbi:DNA-directed RNA polymerase III subunit RPC5 [Actinomortierella wolfii]|nr:DNA-directed RNA polymerase III subunit RPC5 [Actinomortierella wolfii]